MKNLIKTIILVIFFTLFAHIWVYFDKSASDKSTDVRLLALSCGCGFLMGSVFKLQDKVEELENKIDNLKELEKQKLCHTS